MIFPPIIWRYVKAFQTKTLTDIIGVCFDISFSSQILSLKMSLNHIVSLVFLFDSSETLSQNWSVFYLVAPQHDEIWSSQIKILPEKLQILNNWHHCITSFEFAEKNHWTLNARIGWKNFNFVKTFIYMIINVTSRFEQSEAFCEYK